MKNIPIGHAPHTKDNTITSSIAPDQPKSWELSIEAHITSAITNNAVIIYTKD